MLMSVKYHLIKIINIQLLLLKTVSSLGRSLLFYSGSVLKTGNIIKRKTNTKTKTFKECFFLEIQFLIVLNKKIPYTVKP